MQLHYSMKRFPASGLACPLVSASLFLSLELSINACSGVQRLVGAKCQLYWNSLFDTPHPHPNALPIAVFQYSLFFLLDIRLHIEIPTARPLAHTAEDMLIYFSFCVNGIKRSIATDISEYLHALKIILNRCAIIPGKIAGACLRLHVSLNNFLLALCSKWMLSQSDVWVFPKPIPS